MLELLDLGTNVSMLFLCTVGITLLLISSYTSITRCMFNCKRWNIIPTFIAAVLFDYWDNILKNKKSDMMLSIIILFLSIIPISLIWPISYPVIGYYIIKYKRSQRFEKLSNTLCDLY